MADIKITDLVDQAAIDKIIELREEMRALLIEYTNVAKELAKGIDVPIKNLADADRARQSLNEKTKEAIEVGDKLNAVMAEHSRTVANTTNTAARQLMEKEKLNKATREEYTEYGKVDKLLQTVNGSYKGRVIRLVELKGAIDKNRAAQKEAEKELNNHIISQEQYLETMTKLVAEERELKTSKEAVTRMMKAEEKLAQSAADGYKGMSQQLSLLKMAYNDMSDAEKNSEIGKELEATIKSLNAHLVDMAADVGDHQRNVGNYAIASQNGVVATQSLIAVMNKEARTTQDLVDQTKILEEAKLMLNKNDSDYEETLEKLNAKIDENKKQLMDVSDILGKEATSVAEAEAQNKRLTEALKHIDLSSADAKQRLEEMRAQIDRNNRTIGEATGANEKFADTLLNLVGVNINFSNTFQTLGSGGSIIDGLHSKVKTFASTLIGMLANPVVLAFIGVAGVVAGVKWWFDFNKGLQEASLLTENFTGLTGDAADKVTAHMTVISKQMKKGYDETIGGANTLVQQFGVSWDEASRLMQDGIVAGADMSGNMLDNIDKFSGAFKDAGVSADQFMAILAETRNGIFDEKALKSISDAGTRLRAMTKSTATSLDNIGISSKQMQKDLTDGNITMVEAIQQVTDKLKELPPNAQETGEVMKNVFGKKSLQAGEEVLKSISDINDNLDVAKERMGEVGEIREQEMQAEMELQKQLQGLFKMSGTSFEHLTGQAKIFVIKGLTSVIKGVVSVVNWFIKLYNSSSIVRVGVQAIIGTFKNLFSVAKHILTMLGKTFKNFGDGLLAVAKTVESILNGDWSKVAANAAKIKDAFIAQMNNLRGMVVNIGHDVGVNYNKGLEAALKDGPIKELTVDFSNLTDNSSVGNDKKNFASLDGGEDDNSGKGGGSAKRSGGSASRSNKDSQKAAQDELRILEQLEESKLNMMEDGLEKQILLIRQKFKKKLDAIKGNGANEQALRLQLAAECEMEVSKCEEKFDAEREKIDLANRLAIVGKNSAKELELRKKEIEEKRKVELDTAEENGADKTLIEQKYDNMILELTEKFAAKKMEIIEGLYADEQLQRDIAMSDEMNALGKKYAKDLQMAKGNKEKEAELTDKYEHRKWEIEEKYAIESAQSAVKMYENLLQDETLSNEDRKKLREDLAKARMALADKETQHEIEAAQMKADADQKEKEEKIERAKKWVQVASDGLNAINDLSQAIFDAKIARVEKEMEAESQRSEAESALVDSLVEKKVISEEEGEARKRAAADMTAKKQAELEKKKATLQRRAAIFQKANDVAQATMATALALMELWVHPGWPAALPMMGVVSALGALQVATIMSTPIPTYAKGTDFHKGGRAIVGDGGRPEVVFHNGEAWLTPSSPTLVDLPRGAMVLPSITDFTDSPISAEISHFSSVSPYDDKRMRRGVSDIAYLIRQQTRQQREIANRSNYEAFKNRIV